MPIAASIALVLSVALTPASPSFGGPQVVQMPAAQTVQQYVANYFADTPILIKVAECESHFKQYDKDGSVHRGVVNDQDVGIMQINEFYQGKTAQKLGIDIYSIQGNLTYAKYLYGREGVQPWSSSSPCWNKDGKIALK